MKRFIGLLLLFFFVGIGNTAFCSSPRLHFSDLISGPDTGLGDSLGEGTIVTIWGNNLGSTQGASTVYFKDSTATSYEAAYVYYWCNADGGTSGGGPADLYAYHKMQEIAFSIPDEAASGLGSMYVVVDSVTSNELPFTVQAGNIYYVKTTGNNSTGDGAWATPWATVSTDGDGAMVAGKTVPGDIVYSLGVVDDGGPGGNDSGYGYRTNNNKGTDGNPISIVSYPGTIAEAKSAPATGTGIANNGADNDWFNFSKIKVWSIGSGVSTCDGMRAVGNYITGPDATGQGGAFVGSWDTCDSGVVIFGNEIDTFGNLDPEVTSSKHHTFYMKVRAENPDCVGGTYDGYEIDGSPDVAGCIAGGGEMGPLQGGPIEAYELGWNYLHNNSARGGMHVYDESFCGDMTGTLRLHDNVIVDQVGPGFNLMASGSAVAGAPDYFNECWSMPVELYNNLFIRCGVSPTGGTPGPAIALQGERNVSHVKMYNNTIYGYADATADPHDEVALFVRGGSEMRTFGGTWEWINNIVYDIYDADYVSSDQDNGSPTAAHHNLWYNGGDGDPASPPGWDTSPLSSDPLLTNPGSGDYSLQSGSPAKNTGSSTVSSVVPMDILGSDRPQGMTYDIGAYEYDEGGAAVSTISGCTILGGTVQ